MSSLMVHADRHTRSRDPLTSFEAAESIAPEGWTALMDRVYAIVYDAQEPVTREQIVDIYEATRVEAKAKRVAPQRIRSAVAALLDGERTDFGTVMKCTRALRVVDKEGRTAAGHRAQRLAVAA